MESDDILSLVDRLRISEERFHSFLANSSEQIFCVEFDEPIPLDLPEREQVEQVLNHGRYVEANEAFAKVYDATVDEVIGWPIERTLPKSLPAAVSFVEQGVRSGYRVTDLESVEVDKHGNQLYILNNLIPTIVDGKVLRVWGTARDITERKRAEKNLQDLASRLIHAQEGERRRLARELHDDLTQRLAVMAMDIATATDALTESPDRARDDLRQMGQELTDLAGATQELSRQLHPKILEELGLAKAIGAECRRFAKRGHVALDLSLDDGDGGLSREKSLCLYRILQESLSNVARHAQASNVAVELSRNATAVTLSIKDDGVGFDRGANAPSPSLGLVSMAERVRLCGGTLDIASGPEEGTTVTATIPISNESNE